MNRLDRSRRTLAAGLAALAGYVDATGYLSADRYFVSFMSGNTTRLATEVIVAPRLAAIPALLIAGFLFGVTLGGVTAHLASRWRKCAVLALVTALLALAAICALFAQTAAMMVLLVLAMGALNMALRAGEVPVALTYLTGAVVRMGHWLADRLTGRPPQPVLAHALLWLALAAGAALGALSFTRFAASGLFFAAGASALLTLAGLHVSCRYPQP